MRRNGVDNRQQRQVYLRRTEALDKKVWTEMMSEIIEITEMMKKRSNNINLISSCKYSPVSLFFPSGPR